jgi:hypothetical protein
VIEMLIKNLGQTRMQLLESFNHLTDEQLNQKTSFDKKSISQILFHLYMTEKETAVFILNSLNTVRKNMAGITTANPSEHDEGEEGKELFISRFELVQLLNESRFKYVQAIFNEIHGNQLSERFIEHPMFGPISLEKLLETIWMNEQRSIIQINEIKQELFRIDSPIMEIGEF